MTRARITIAVGCATLAYWVVLYAFVFQDWYLSWPLTGLLLKMSLPVALAANIAGTLTIFRFPPRQNLKKALVLGLHGIPLAAAVVFLWWLFLGVYI
jgi:hypothetical protein